MDDDALQSAEVIGRILERAFREGYVAGEQDARRVADKEPFRGPTRCWEMSKSYGTALHLKRTADKIAGGQP